MRGRKRGLEDCVVVPLRPRGFEPGIVFRQRSDVCFDAVEIAKGTRLELDFEDFLSEFDVFRPVLQFASVLRGNIERAVWVEDHVCSSRAAIVFDIVFDGLEERDGRESQKFVFKCLRQLSGRVAGDGFLFDIPIEFDSLCQGAVCGFFRADERAVFGHSCLDICPDGIICEWRVRLQASESEIQVLLDLCLDRLCELVCRHGWLLIDMRDALCRAGCAYL